MKRMSFAILAILCLLLSMASAESLPETEVTLDSIYDLDFSAFTLIEPYIAYAKSGEPGGFVNLRWAPSRDAALQHRMHDGDEVIVYAVGGDWSQIMDIESGYIGFALSALLTTEEPEAVVLAELDENTPFIDFDIKMDAIPEGYTYDTEEHGGSLYATFVSEDPEAVKVYVSIAYAPVFAGYTLKSDLSVEEFEAAKKELIADYNDPVVEMRETDYGTALITVTEGNAQTAYADMIMVYQGYVIRINLQKPTELTDEDMELVTQIATDMWIIEQ